MTEQLLDELDLVRTVLEHRLRQADLERILHALSERDRSELLHKVGDLLRHISALVEVSSKMSDTLSLDILLPRLMTIVTETLGADRSTLFLYDEETDELFSRVAQGEQVGEIRIPAGAGIAGSVFSTGEGCIIADAYADPRFNPEVDRRTGYRTRNILCLPVRYKGRAIGVTQVLNKHDGAFDGEDLRLLEALTAQAASALENAQLYERVEKARREEAQLLEVTSAIASELQLDTLLERVISATTEMLEADRSTLFMHDPKTGELWSRVAEGIGYKEIRFPADAGIAGACFASGEVVNIADAYEDSRFNREVDRRTGYRTRSVLCMPVVNKEGRKLAVIQVLNRRGGPFRVVDEKRLRAFSAQVAIALENAQLFDDVLNERNYNESILRSLSNGVLTLDVDGRVRKANRAVLDILGQGLDDVLDHTLESLLPGAGNHWVRDSLAKVVASGEVDIAMDAELALGAGSSASVNLTTVPLRHINNGPIGYMLVLEDITAEKRAKGTLARYMTKEVADRLLEAGEDVLGGQSQVATVLFSDIRGFTSIAEELGPRETVAMLNDYFTDMIEVIFSHRGILDKYIGDAIMALFGAPFPSADDADNAVLVANEMIRVLRTFNARRQAAGKHTIDVGIGISTGDLVAGNIGSPKRMDYTVIGDTVNLAARLESATKYYGVKILYSEFTAASLRNATLRRRLDRIRVKGRHEPVLVYESLDHHDEAGRADLDRLLDAFEEGIERYFRADWRNAARHFARALDVKPDDSPSRLYLGRCEHYLTQPPAGDWDGVWSMQTK
ncbi:MAG: GAF domain-containing protein [Ectothiorhodospiraceae bacterium]|nr:GAF domain-containing protein [Chromatiales bacterium]MCP5153341.1 GAF domain-containing protein [Ectothiorhodospiraceae bacterium]